MPPIILNTLEKAAMVELHQNFNKHIKFIADRTYLQRMQATPDSENPDNFANRQFKEILDDPGKFIAPQRSAGIVRGNHGLRHATRVAIYTDMLHRFRSTKILDKSGNPDKFPEKAINQVAKFFDITPEDVLMLTKLAAFFHDSAREDESVDQWDHRSAENCYDFLVQQGVREEIARFFANSARYKSERENFNEYLNTLGITKPSDQNNFNYMRQLIDCADTLDIMRCHSPFKGFYLDNFFRTKGHLDNRKAANQLMLGVHQLLAAEGDLCADSIQISEEPPSFLPITGSTNVEWDENTKLDFEFSEDPYSFMQNYINKYIDQNNLLLPKTDTSATAGLNIVKSSLITECNWEELFAQNDQFVFIKTDHSVDQIGHIVTQQEPSKHIINIKKDSIEFPKSGEDDSLSEEQISATMVILNNLIAQGGHDAINPLIMAPNNVFTVNMMTILMKCIKQANIAVAFIPSADSDPKMKTVIEKYNNEINWHPPHKKNKTKF